MLKRIRAFLLVSLLLMSCSLATTVMQGQTQSTAPANANQTAAVSPVAGASATSPAAIASSPTSPAAVEPTPTKTAQPTATLPPQPSPTPAYTAFEANGVSLNLPLGLAKELRSDIVPAIQTLPDEPFWTAQPVILDLSLMGYADTLNTYHRPHIRVYPIKEYIQVNDAAKNQIAALQDLLAKKPQQPSRLPFIPLFNAAQVFHAGLTYLSFQNGSGVRFLTQYDQAIIPINNQELFYTFQGITSDGVYYVSAILPVSDPSLPATGQLTTAEMDKIAKNFEAYLKQTTQALDKEPAASFTPRLDALDSLVTSLKAAPELSGLSSADIPPTAQWKPQTNIPGPVYAMSQDQIDALMKQTADVRKDQITFNGQTCPVSGYTIETKDPTPYFLTMYKMPAAQLIPGFKTIEAIQTNCAIPGLGEFVRTPADNLIINVGGVFFILGRQ